MINSTIPTVGAEIEVYGCLANFLSADMSESRELIVTVRVTPGNARVICDRAAKAGSTATALSPSVVQVSGKACVAKYQGNSLSDEGYLQASVSQSLIALQRMLAKRMRFSA
jgi:hypothetical protein